MKNRIIELGKLNWWIIVFLMIIFFVLMGLLYLKADEVTKDPCSICSKRMGEKVTCTIGGGFDTTTIEFYPNGTITQDKGESSYPNNPINQFNERIKVD